MDAYVRKLQLTELEILKEIDRICRKNDIEYSLYGGSLLGAIRHNGFIPWDDDIDIAMTRDNYLKFIKVCKHNLNNKFFLDCYETNKKYGAFYAKIKLKNTLFVEYKNKDDYDKTNCIWVDIFPLDYVSGRMNKKQQKSYKYYRYITTLITIKNGTKYYKNSKIKKTIYGFILKFIPFKWMLNLLYKKVCGNIKDKYICSYPSAYGLAKETYEISKLLPYKEVPFEDKNYMIFSGYDFILSRMYGNYMKLPPKEKRVNHKPYLIKFPDGETLKFDKPDN